MVEVDRFWCRPEGRYRADDDGYLLDPELLVLNTSLNPQATRTIHLAAHRCLILVGEPGSGKTTALARHAPLLPDLDHTPVALTLDLSACDSSDLTAVFTQPTIADWIAGSHELALVIDGFDEAHSRMPTLPSRLAAAIERWPLDRLWLRVACRTADWPALLDAKVTNSLDDAACYELLPLRAADVAAIAALGTDTAPFLEAVRNAGVVALASRPLTLTMLVRAFKASSALTPDTAVLYRAGIAALCDEANPARIAAGVAGSLTPSQRVVVASRIAAYSLLADRPTLFDGSVADADKTDLTVDELVGGHENVGADPVPVGAEQVRETLRTGLFSGCGGRRLGWSHATFRDYLAAVWIHTNLSDPQIRELVLAEGGRVYPQTTGVAVWLPALDPQRFAWIANADPEAFVGDIAHASAGIRVAVLDGLHARVSDGTFRRDLRTSYRTLNHPNIATQIRPWLADPAMEVRMLACDVARDCEVSELRDDLVAVVLNDTLTFRERSRAGWSLFVLGRSAPVHDLRPVALGDVGDDPDDELRGVTLSVSWPHAVTTAQVLENLPTPKRSNLHGSYAGFLGDLRVGLTDADLPAVLRWLDSGPNVMDHRIAALANSAIRLVLRHLDDPQAQDLITNVITSRAADYEGLLYRDFDDSPDPLDDTNLRRKLADVYLSSAHQPDDNVLYYLTERSPHGLGLVRSEDALWLADRYQAKATERASLGRIASGLFWDGSTEVCRLYLDLPTGHPLRTDLIDGWAAAIPLDSDVAKQRREGNYRLREREQEQQDRLDADTVVADIGSHLDEFEAGSTDGYWQAMQLLSQPPGSEYLNDQMLTRVVDTKRWAALDEQLRQRFIDLASTYLTQGRCRTDEWLNRPGRVWYPAQAGMRALVLLAEHSPGELPRLTPEVWREWAPTIIVGRIHHSAEERAIKRRLIAAARPHAHSEMVATLIECLAHGVEHDEYTYVHDDDIDSVWSDELAEALATIASETPDSNSTLNEIVAWVAVHDLDRIRPTLHRWIDEVDTSGDPTDRAVTAASTLFRRDPTSFPQMMATLANPVMSTRVLQATAGFHQPIPAYQPSELADLYLRLADEFPHAADPDPLASGSVGFREQITQWRDAILSHLTELGTSESVEAVERIAAALPHLTWINRTAEEARTAHRRSAWIPVAPAVLAQLAADGSKRQVRTADELLLLVVEALADVQQKLHGAAPDAQFLWNSTPRTPKTEDSMSDFVLQRLHDRLVQGGAIIDREVQVRRHTDQGIGERTDIKVSAVAPGPPPQELIVMIEAKLAWNGERSTAMRAQLVDQYLVPIASKHGIYLVFWADPIDEWDQADRTAKRVAALDRDTIREELEAQGLELESEGFRIAVVILDVTWPKRSDVARP